MPQFQDHFAPVAATYASARPSYPPLLFAWLAKTCSARDLVWDCATGNGQAAVALGDWFTRVIATDASSEQLVHAQPHDRVIYRRTSAEDSGLRDASVDLITVAQALHWFDLPRFHREVRRVLKPNGLFAAWSYGRLRIDDPAVDRFFQSFYSETLSAYWPAERHHVETGYRDLAFPLRLQPVPTFTMTDGWTCGQVFGYVRSWSATAKLCEARGEVAMDSFIARLLQIWGDPERTCVVTWPLTILVGHPLDDSI
ncbi:class I SAM-dependent methyltransferase [Thiocystis violascens]|uniref:Methylase involved in ubiquinone/menaquinone biosynthesis n=1 Tax=Thiocystis violascens (strain ATCC 17096 / DSM 198 / 6111) TaxID=765911 RepID=I3YFD7_THIV6|nr:class I SAM-dependent methyltransferase [Thiocystis violascens]AFL75705.1 methylase involved in ubiquinone/menaquinone biosynthesis [Thiocystis violascens DSM 198]